MKKLLTIIITALILFSASGVQAGTETIITPGITGTGFGISTDIIDNTAIVGMSGAGVVFEETNKGWAEKALLTPGDVEENRFGSHVAISENFIAVSGNEKAYIFQKPANGWTDMNETKVLSLFQPGYGMIGIFDLAIHGNTFVICYQTDFQGVTVKIVNIYDYNGGEWILSDTIISENHGECADVYEDYVIIGSQNSGALIYRRTENGRWVQETQLIADDMESTVCFGRDVAITDGFAIVGDKNTSSVYIFEHNGNQWIQKQKFTEYDAYGKAVYYGTSVDITKDYAIVGSFGYRAGIANAPFCGAAFLYKRQDNNVFEKIDRYLAPISESLGFYGWSVALSEDHFIIGHIQNPSFSDNANGSAVIYNLFALGDLDRDGCVGKNDAAILRTFLNRPLIECPECDLDGDDRITILDARKLVTLCTNANCECP